MDQSEISLLTAKLNATIRQQDEIQKIIFRQKRDNLAALYAGQISVEAWIARLHKTNRQLKTSQAIVRKAKHDIAMLSRVGKSPTEGRFTVGIE